MNRFDSMTKEQYRAAKDGFFLQYNPPASKPVETMDLVMRQENALAIIKGDRKMEFRQINDDNFNMLNDEETYTWMMDHRKDEKMDTEAMYEFLCSVRPVMTLHFHDEENSWFLDVECTKNDLTYVFPKEVEYLQKRFGCHELDGILEDFEKRNDPMRPAFFYFALGKVLDTNLAS